MKTFISAATVLAVLCAPVSLRAEDVAARVNGVTITEAQVRELSERIASVEGGTADAQREQALQSLIDMEILAQQAKAEKVEASKQDLDQQFDQIKSQYQTAEAFQQALASNKATEELLRKEISTGLTVQKLVDSHVTVKLPPDAAEKYYKEHPDEFQQPPEVRASHILFRTKPDSDKDVAKRRAEETLARLKKGEDFGKLAKELSEDPGSAQNDGDLGFFAHDAMVGPFADTAFALKKGELSGVVETQYGFHIIKVTDTRAAGLMPFADAKDDIVNELDEQERDKAEHAYLDELKKHAKIEIVAPKKADAPTPAPTQPAAS